MPSLYVFDFDQTIFRSPLLHPKLGDAFIEWCQSSVIQGEGLGFFDDLGTLGEEAGVPASPDLSYYVPDVIAAAQKAVAEGHHVIVMTGRTREFAARVKHILSVVDFPYHGLYLKRDNIMGTIKFKSSTAASVIKDIQKGSTNCYDVAAGGKCEKTVVTTTTSATASSMMTTSSSSSSSFMSSSSSSSSICDHASPSDAFSLEPPSSASSSSSSTNNNSSNNKNNRKKSSGSSLDRVIFYDDRQQQLAAITSKIIEWFPRQFRLEKVLIEAPPKYIDDPKLENNLLWKLLRRSKERIDLVPKRAGHQEPFQVLKKSLSSSPHLLKALKEQEQEEQNKEK